MTLWFGKRFEKKFVARGPIWFACIAAKRLFFPKIFTHVTLRSWLKLFAFLLAQCSPNKISNDVEAGD